MTYDEKRYLYESIMTEIAKHVKKIINENASDNAYQSNKITKFIKLALEKSKLYKNPRSYFVCICNLPRLRRICSSPSPDLVSDIHSGGYFKNDEIIISDLDGYHYHINFGDLKYLDDSDVVGDILTEYDLDDIYKNRQEVFKNAFDLYKLKNDIKDDDWRHNWRIDYKEYRSSQEEYINKNEVCLLLLCGPKTAFRLTQTYKDLKIVHPELIDYVLCINANGYKKIDDIAHEK